MDDFVISLLWMVWTHVDDSTATAKASALLGRIVVVVSQEKRHGVDFWYG